MGRASLALVVFVALCAAACGIKAAPRPPLEATAAETSSAPDAGCSSCGAPKP